MIRDEIRAENVKRCPLCGDENRRLLYAGLRDHLFGAPGEWTLKECRRCGTAYLDPRPTSEDIGKVYAKYYTHSIADQPKANSPVHRFYRAIKAGYLGRRWGYDKGLRTWQKALAPLLYLHPGRRAQLDSTVMYLGAMPGARLLDVGTGSGTLIEHLGNLGWRAEGVEPDPLAVQAAQERGLPVYLGTLEDRSYPDATFDAVTMSHVIEHVHRPHALLRECRRILKIGGRLVIVTPNISSLGHDRFKAAWRGLEPPRHLQILTPSALLHLAERAGFRKSSVQTSMQSAHSMYVTSRSIRLADTCAGKEVTSRTERLRGRLMQHAEWAALRSRADVGEEIVAVLEK